MNVSRVSRSELIAIVGGLLLAAGLFLHWYHLNSRLAKLAGHHGPNLSLTGWEVHTILRLLLLAAAAAPLILTYIVMRGHALSWPRGELTAVVAIAALGLLFYNGIVSRPGDPPGEIALQVGFFVSLLGSILMLVGAAARSSETGRARKPPGVL